MFIHSKKALEAAVYADSRAFFFSLLAKFRLL